MRLAESVAKQGPAGCNVAVRIETKPRDNLADLGFVRQARSEAIDGALDCGFIEPHRH